MGKVKLQRGGEEFELFQDYWKLYQEHLAVEDSEAYWEKALEGGQAFYQKYKTPFAKDLAVAYMSELERRAKNGI